MHQGNETPCNTPPPPTPAPPLPEPEPSMASNDIDGLNSWKQKPANAKVRQFMNILEQLPRLCSPTICGTLSQPTTRSERLSRGTELFEWSLEQKAILSPANITTDPDSTDEWHNAAEINSALRKHDAEKFFSQRTIAPSPLISTTPSAKRQFRRPFAATFDDIICDEDDEDEDEDMSEDMIEMSQDDNHLDRSHNKGTNGNLSDNDNVDDDERIQFEAQEDMDNNFLFSPQPVRSSQSQQNMDIFSPSTFDRVMEDESTLQSTPKTIASSVQGTRSISRRSGVLD